MRPSFRDHAGAMTQTDIFDRIERWRDHQAFGAATHLPFARRHRLRPTLARLLDMVPIEDIAGPARHRGAWLGLDDVWPGDPAQGGNLAAAWGDQPEALFALATDAMPHAHGFDWLRDLAANRQADGCPVAYAATAIWLTRYGRWQATAWRSDLLARRLANWTMHWRLITAGAPDEEAADTIGATMIRSARRQLRFLDRCAARDVDQQARIGALCHGIVAAIGLCPGRAIAERSIPPLLDRLLRRLDETLTTQIQPDGGHVSRSPSKQFAVVCDLALVRDALDSSLLGVPEWVQRSLDRTAPILRMLRHPDGGLALFQGAHEGQPAAIDLALKLSATGGASPTVARHAGYARVSADNGQLLMDCGTGQTGEGHRGPLAIELSIGRQRVIVNCGAMTAGGAAWQSALRATAAHSTLCIADTNADTQVRGRQGQHWDNQPTISELEGEWLMEASHDGYAERFGLRHTRAVYCDNKGEDWRGEDTLTPITGTTAERQLFTVRFHLHPRVRADLAQDQATVLIRLPNKSGWRFRSRGGQIRLATSIYIADGETVQRCEQIVVTGSTGPDGAQVRWALQRVA